MKKTFEEIMQRFDEINNAHDILSIVARESHNAVILINTDLEIYWVNNEFTKISGYTLEEFTSTFGKNLLDASSNPEVKAIIQRCAQTHQTGIYEAQLVSKDGTSMWLQTTLTPLMDGQEVKGYIAIDADITARKEAEKQIKEYNNAIQQQAEELRMQSEALSETNVRLEERHEEVTQQQEELRAQHEQLQAINTELSAHNAELERVLHELKSAQSQIVQSERMSSLGQLTAGIAHEINNPVNYVKGGIEAIRPVLDDLIELSELYDDLNDKNVNKILKEAAELKEDIEYDDLIEGLDNLMNSIKMGAERTSEIVKGLRTFSRLEEGTPEMSNLQEVVESALVIVKNQAKKRIEIVRQYETLPEIECYPGNLNQVFVNILFNAIQAITDEGTITVDIKAVKHHNIDMALVSIADTGMGMSEETKRRCFEPFFTKKDVGEGTGLGLSIVFSLIQKHKGTIEVTSELGKGSKFSIYLPMQDVPSEEEQLLLEAIHHAK